MTVGDAPSLAVPTAGRYRVDPQRSTVTYSGRHMFGLGAVKATFTIAASGELLVADPVAASTVVVSVDAGSFRSDKSRRDDHVRSASLLDAATYPNITFTSDGLREQGAGWLLDGALTAHGQTVPVQVVIDRATNEGDGVRVHAHVERLDRYAFGVTKVKGMAGRYLDLDLDVFAVPA
jgi:polyisoprenoid-binding protein YceI